MVSRQNSLLKMPKLRSTQVGFALGLECFMEQLEIIYIYIYLNLTNTRRKRQIKSRIRSQDRLENGKEEGIRDSLAIRPKHYHA